MRIATVSDLHTDFSENRDLLVRLATEIHARSVDVLVVAGDVSHVDDRIDRALRALAAVAPRLVYLPGNHDLWETAIADGLVTDTWQRYTTHLRGLAEAATAHYLPAAPLVVGDVALVGTCGWYDYSFAEPWVLEQVGEAALAKKKLGPMAWSDAAYVSFRHPDGQPMADAEVARRMEAALAEQLAQVEADPSVRRVVVVTHHQPFREVVRRSGSLPWEYFCAFMGSEGLGRTILAHSAKLHTVVYGHSHIVAEHHIAGHRVYGTALGYPRERKGLDVEAIVRSRIGWIEL